MANLSFLTIGIPASGRLVFRNIHDQVIAAVTTVVTTTPSSGVPSSRKGKGQGKRKIFRVRRADFSSQENYEYALRAALLESEFAIRPADEVPVVQPRQTKPKVPQKLRVADTEIKISAEAFAALQRAADLDELQLIELFITVIDSEYP